MPIYEYRCADCKRRVSVFFRSFSAAESGAAEARCPNCGSDKLTRLMSKVSVISGGRGDSDDFGGEDFGGEDMGDMGGMGDMGDMGGLEQMMAGVDENDPRSVARWARAMQAQTGEDLGPEFNTALSRIESGEDPDRVMDDMDPAMGMGGDGDDDGGEFEE